MAHYVSAEANKIMMTGSKAKPNANLTRTVAESSRLPGWSGEEFFRYMSKVGIVPDLADYIVLMHCSPRLSTTSHGFKPTRRPMAMMVPFTQNPMILHQFPSYCLSRWNLRACLWYMTCSQTVKQPMGVATFQGQVCHATKDLDYSQLIVVQSTGA